VRKTIAIWSLGAIAFFSALAWAQTTVKADQGKPGNQGPWPVTGGTFNPDSGSVFVLPNKCSAIVQTNDAGIGATPSRVPVNGGTAGRIYIQICNSLLNANGSQCICDGQLCPGAVAVGQPGDVLNTGDCATYNIDLLDGGVPCCVCNGAGIFLPATECVP